MVEGVVNGEEPGEVHVLLVGGGVRGGGGVFLRVPARDLLQDRVRGGQRPTLEDACSSLE